MRGPPGIAALAALLGLYGGSIVLAWIFGPHAGDFGWVGRVAALAYGVLCLAASRALWTASRAGFLLFAIAALINCVGGALLIAQLASSPAHWLGLALLLVFWGTLIAYAYRNTGSRRTAGIAR